MEVDETDGIQRKSVNVWGRQLITRNVGIQNIRNIDLFEKVKLSIYMLPVSIDLQ